MLFSKNKQAFYDEEFEYADLPDDVIVIDTTTWQTLLSKINTGYYVSYVDEAVVTSSTSRPSIYYTYSETDQTWIQTEEQKVSEEVVTKKSRLKLAQDYYQKVSDEIIEITYMLEDLDYTTHSQEELTDLKNQYSAYRTLLRAYLKTDGSETIPSLLTT